MARNFTFTSESVTEGHPDKMADQISDSVLDAILAEDPQGRVACETLLTTGLCVIAGEITTSAYVDIPKLARSVIKEIGYDNAAYGFDGNTCGVIISIDEQSSDIAMGVDSGDNKDEGAGDQGLMFGYACDETDVLMPAAIYYSHQILKDLATIRKQDADSILGPDSKSQISLVYDDAGRPTGVHKVVLSTQHSKEATQADILALVTPVIANVLPDGWMVTGDDLLVNPTGQFVIGGPDGDTGLTGRKIIVDTYGGAAPHGGGAFSGKGLASRCTIQIAYAIGVAEPVSLYANTHGTGTVDDQKLQEALRDCMDLTPRGIRRHLGMNAPIYAPTAAYGHFGRIAGEAGVGTFSWEATDLVDALRAAAR